MINVKKYKFILENNGRLSLFSAYIAPSLMALTEGGCYLPVHAP